MTRPSTTRKLLREAGTVAERHQAAVVSLSHSIAYCRQRMDLLAQSIQQATSQTYIAGLRVREQMAWQRMQDLLSQRSVQAEIVQQIFDDAKATAEAVLKKENKLLKIGGSLIDAVELIDAAAKWVQTGESEDLGKVSTGILLTGVFSGVVSAGLALIAIAVPLAPAVAAVTVFVASVVFSSYLNDQGLEYAFSNIKSSFDKIIGQLDGTAHFRVVDPLAIDMDGNGLQTVGIGHSPILFDHDGDGIRTGTGWLTGADAWLVRDINRNGTIDSGAEMFGDQTRLQNGTTATSGLQALVDLDSNGDGLINALDALFAELKIWRDANHNGISEAEELQTLTEAGLAEITLTGDGSSTQIQQEGGHYSSGSIVQVTRTDGSTTTAADLHVHSDTFYSQYKENIDIPEDLQHLPDIPGMGRLRNLRQAAATSAELADILKQYAQADSRSAQQALCVNRHRRCRAKQVRVQHLCKQHLPDRSCLSAMGMY